jgi:uncharacterized protein YjaZ
VGCTVSLKRSRKQFQRRKAEITRAIAATDKQLTEVESTLDAGQEGVQNAEDKDKALEQIEEEQIAFDSSRKLLQELLLKARKSNFLLCNQEDGRPLNRRLA